MFYYVSAHQLNGCTMTSMGHRYENVTVFPFFDGDGIIHCHMIILPDREGVYLADAAPHQISVSWSHKLVMQQPIANYPKINPDRAEEIRRLWHFDPWWVLTRPEYANQSWVKTIKETNCAEMFFENTPMVYFDPALENLKLAAMAKSGDEEVMKRFKPKMLPPRQVGKPTTLGKNKRKQGWSLKKPPWGSWSKFKFRF